ncbi:hypothetical protein ACFL5O_06135, partial [Myxococcota bacterium]
GGATSGGATSGGATLGGATLGGATLGGATSGGATSGGATSGGATSGGATSGGESTCVQGIQTGDPCDAVVDLKPCERGARTCDCGSDGLWTCTPNDAAGSGGAGGEPPAETGGADTAGTGGKPPDGTGGEGTAGSMSAGCGKDASLQSGSATIDVGGTQRAYILKVPDDYDANQPHKLVFAFHGRGGSASRVAGNGNNDYYGLYSRAEGSAIFVAPEGIDAGWRNTGGRDVAFVGAMLDEFDSGLCIDGGRIFSVGFSFGGMMSDAIGCAMADVFRAIAPMAGAIPNDEHPYSECNQVNQHPIAVWMAHGDNDTVVPLGDGMDALNLFLERSQCEPQTMPVTPDPCVAYQGCLPDYPIHFCQFQGGHQVPSFAADAIWEFFDQF